MEETFINKIFCADCREKMKEIPSDSIDTIITDPPYNLGFMNKSWDKSGIAFQPETWAEMLRIAKPGATLLAFGGSRTSHRIACAIEDAGWIIKDTIMWLYASGFPKATDISKQLDLKAGVEKEIIGISKRHGGGASHIFSESGTSPVTSPAIEWNGWKSHGLKPAYEPIIVAMKSNEGSYVDNALKWGVSGLNIDGGRVEGQPHHNYNRTSGENSFVGESTEEFNTPSSGRYPANVILECICDDVIVEGEKKKPYEYKDQNYQVEGFIKDIKPQSPSNYNDKSQRVIHTNPDCPCRILDEQSGTLKSGFMKQDQKRTQHGGFHGGFPRDRIGERDTYGDSGGASRFFYVAKASKKERNFGCDNLEEKQASWDGRETPIENPYQRNNNIQRNNHPTVKPNCLMEYLCKLTKTPTGGIVFDPFMGSGTTIMAAIKTGRQYLGIEKEKDYFKIAEARIDATIQKESDDLGLFGKEAI